MASNTLGADSVCGLQHLKVLTAKHLESRFWRHFVKQKGGCDAIQGLEGRVRCYTRGGAMLYKGGGCDAIQGGAMLYNVLHDWPNDVADVLQCR